MTDMQTAPLGTRVMVKDLNFQDHIGTIRGFLPLTSGIFPWISFDDGSDTIYLGCYVWIPIREIISQWDAEYPLRIRAD